MKEIVLWLVAALFGLLTRKKVVVVSLFSLLAVALIVVGVKTINYTSNFTVPDEQIKEPVWIPENAEIRSTYEVEPGTFKIKISADEMQTTTTNERVLVVYNVSVSSVEYYRGTPDGTFYYTTMEVSPPLRNGFATYWKPTFDKEEGAFQYTLVKNKAEGYFVGTILLAVGAGILLYITFWILIPALFRLMVRIERRVES